MRASLVAIVLVGAIAVAVIAFRFRPADSIAGPLLPQANQPRNPDAVMDEPLTSIEQRSISPAHWEAAETPAESAQDTEQADASGLTPDEKLTALLRVHARYMNLPPDAPTAARVTAEYWFVSECVENILRESGRADYGDPVELELKGGFSLRPSSPDEWVFAASRARYSFRKGEFPAYDFVRTRWALQNKGEAVPPTTDENHIAYEVLFREALGALGVADITEAHAGD